MLSIVIPVLNEWHYTKQCLEGLRKTVSPETCIIVIDNGSTDQTPACLAKERDLRVIRNEINRGCAAAWNQGVRAFPAEWTVILNNDVLLPSGWLNGLLCFAEKNKLDVVSPGMREGELNYDLEKYAQEFVQKMKGTFRPGTANGVCFAVRHDVFDTIGFFDENFRIGQFEDTDFFLRARRAGFRLATTGESFIHHFGSVTQNAVRKEETALRYEAENRAYFRKKWNLTAPRRFVMRLKTKAAGFYRSHTERRKFGHSLSEKWIDGQLQYH